MSVSTSSRAPITEKLLDFGKKAEGADVALFFYAGNGIAVNGANYLLPVDADLKSEMDVKLGAAINVDLTLEQTRAMPGSSWCSSMPAATIRSRPGFTPPRPPAAPMCSPVSPR